MIVEPAPLHARSPLQRLLRGAGFVAPFALLAAFLTGGLLGPKPVHDPAVDASASAAAPASAPDSPGASPADSPMAPPRAVTALDLVVFPVTYRTIHVDTPSSAMARRMRTGGLPELAVVAGYITMIDGPMRCVGHVPLEAWCDRTGVLFEVPKAAGADTSGLRPAHLHVSVPAGVVLPPAVAGPTGGTASGFVAVMVAGRFATPTCAGDPSTCDRGFVVDRLVWSSGAEEPLQPLVELGQGRADNATPPEPEDAERLPLVAVLATPTVIAGLDPAAGAAAKRIPGAPGAVWYVRDVVLARDGSLLTRWLLLDPSTHGLLATAPADVPGPDESGPATG